MGDRPDKGYFFEKKIYWWSCEDVLNGTVSFKRRDVVSLKIHPRLVISPRGVRTRKRKIETY